MPQNFWAALPTHWLQFQAEMVWKTKQAINLNFQSAWFKQWLWLHSLRWDIAYCVIFVNAVKTRCVNGCGIFGRFGWNFLPTALCTFYQVHPYLKWSVAQDIFPCEYTLFPIKLILEWYCPLTHTGSIESPRGCKHCNISSEVERIIWSACKFSRQRNSMYTCCSFVWRTFLVKNVIELENVQRHATNLMISHTGLQVQAYCIAVVSTDDDLRDQWPRLLS